MDMVALSPSSPLDPLHNWLQYVGLVGVLIALWQMYRSKQKDHANEIAWRAKMDERLSHSEKEPVQPIVFDGDKLVRYWPVLIAGVALLAILWKQNGK